MTESESDGLGYGVIMITGTMARVTVLLPQSLIMIAVTASQ
jgi:hypothetical protein